MNIFEFAMKMEKDGENYYREIAEKTKIPGIKKILEMLADDEVKHCLTIQKMSNNSKVIFEKTGILENAKNVFEQLKEEKDALIENHEQMDLYIKAQEIEKKSEDFYREKSSQISDNDQKKIFLEIAWEENRHYFLLENIINMVRAPKEWVENAEYQHVEDY